jgi:hypothetical protein
MSAEYQFAISGANRRITARGWRVEAVANGRWTCELEVPSLDGSYRAAIDDDVWPSELIGLVSASAANPSVLTTDEPHGGVSGQLVTIGGNSQIPTGLYRITVLSATTFSIPYNNAVAGTGGSVMRRIFGGSVTKPTIAGVGGTGRPPFVNKIEAGDYSARTERRYLNTTLPAGTLKSQLTTLANAVPGIGLHPSQLDGPPMPQVTLTYVLVRDVLNQLGVAAGDWVWEIDEYAFLRMYPPGTDRCPVDVVDGNGVAIGDIQVYPTRDQYANRVILRFSDVAHSAYAFLGTTANFADGEQVVVGSTTYTFRAAPAAANDVAIGPTNTDSLNNLIVAITTGSGGGSANSQVTAYLLAPGGLKAIALTAGAAGNSIGISTTAVNAHWFGEGNVPLSTLALGADESLTNVATAADPSAASDPWEALVESPDVTSLDVANQLASSYLAAKFIEPRIVTFKTRALGVRPGQVLTINVATRDVNTTFLITQVNTSCEDGVHVFRDVTAVESLSLHASDRWRELYKQWSKTSPASSGASTIIAGGGGGGGGGSADIGPGTTGRLAKWTSGTTIGDSLITESGSTIGIAGDVIANTYTGSGAGLTNLPAAALTGTIADARLSSNVVLKNAASNAFAGNVTVGGTLGVAGATSLSSVTTTGGATIGTTLAVTGGATVGGTLDVTGAATLHNTINVTGAATLGSTLAVAGNTTIGGSLHFTANGSFPGQGSFYKDPSFGLTAIAATGSTYDFALINPSGANLILRVPTGTSDLVTTGAIYSGGYVSATTGWRITNAGAADFRSIAATELHVKVFATDVERALAGGELIAKSVAVLVADVVMPGYGAAVTITVEDLAGASGMQVFAAGDWVMLRILSRTGGTLTVDAAYGQVSAPAMGLPGNTQSWTWTRGASATGGTTAPGATVPAKGLAIDFGVSGSGYYEVQGADGAYDANGPYAQIVTWVTSPVVANQTLRVRFGNLVGVTSVSNEYGLLAGTYAASNGRFFRASNTTFELHGIDLLLWDGTTNTVKLDHTAPYLAMGSPRPSSYTDGITGLWFGKDAGAYKFRIGQPGGSGIAWDGSTLQVSGAITVTGGNAAKTDLSNVTGAYAGSSSGAGGPAKWVAPTVPVSAINGSGLYLGSNIMGFYDTSVGWRAYIQSNGAFGLFNASGVAGLTWDGTTLTINGNGTFTGTINASAGTFGNFQISGGNISSTYGLLTLNYSGLITVGSGSDSVNMTAFGAGGTGNIRFWVGNVGGTSRTMYILTDGTVVASVVATNSYINAGTYFVTNHGASGTGLTFVNDINTYYTSDSTGRLMWSAAGLRMFWDGGQLFPEITLAKDCGHPSFQWRQVYCQSVNQSSDGRLKTAIAPTIYGTAFVLGLRPVDFEWIAGGARGHGLIAQDVAALAPEFAGVHYDARGVADSLNYSAFLGPLIRAFQELEARVRALEDRRIQ